MTTYNYFSLTTSDGSTLSKRFKVVEGGYKRFKEKKQTIETTLDGELDISQGAIFETFNFNVKVYQEDPENSEGDAPWGTLADLEQFYEYNNPNGTPSDVLTMVDHFGNTKYVTFAETFAPEGATVFLEGQNAVYFVQISLKRISSASGPSGPS
jgi:hypothetical protein